MTQVFRAWISFAALGAGILHLALAAGAPLPVVFAMVVFGAAECVWAAAVLSRDRFVGAPLVRVLALVPVLFWGAILMVAALADATGWGSALPFVPMGLATLFDLMIAASLSVALRRTREAEAASPEAPASARSTPRAGAYLVGMFAGALLISMAVTPALLFTAAGAGHSHGAETPEISPSEGQHGH